MKEITSIQVAMFVDLNTLDDAELKKALTQGYPFIFYKDVQALKNHQYAEVGSRLRTRASWVLFVMILVCFTFLANAVFHFYLYFSAFEIVNIILAVLWFWLGIAMLYLGMKRHKNMRALGTWLLKKKAEQVE